MPEGDKLAKLIVQRKRQERKNDQMRLRKNRIALDRLKVQTAHVDWQKRVRAHEFFAEENLYMRKLEQIYERQLNIEDKRRQEEEKIEMEREESEQQRQTNVVANQERQDRERARHLHGMKQERTKSFMSKARMLSSGYRDNDPPLAYYKRNGLVPPDRMVTPEISANAQASFGGGIRPPPSSEHLHKSIRTQETLYGVTVPHGRSQDSARSRVSSTASKSDLQSVTTADDAAINYDQAIDEVIQVQVNVRPSTAPGSKRQTSGNRSLLKGTGMVTEVNGAESESDEDVEARRPATATGTVRFLDSAAVAAAGLCETEARSAHGRSQRRRSSAMRSPQMMMFRRRSLATPASSPLNSARRSAPPSPRGRNARTGQGEQCLMSNAEQERIRLKMSEKKLCLERERAKRAMIDNATPKTRRTVSARTWRHFPAFEAWKVRNQTQTFAVEHVKRRRTTNHMELMIDYVGRCERGEIMGDGAEAHRALLSSTVKHLRSLHGDVEQFVRKKT